MDIIFEELDDQGKEMWENLGNPNFIDKFTADKPEKIKTPSENKKYNQLKVQLLELVKWNELELQKGKLALQDHMKHERYFSAHEVRTRCSELEYINRLLPHLIDGGTIFNLETTIELIDDTT